MQVKTNINTVLQILTLILLVVVIAMLYPLVRDTTGNPPKTEVDDGISPAATGLFGIRVRQFGALVDLHHDVSTSYSARTTLEPSSFDLMFPRYLCKGAFDLSELTVSIRVATGDRGAKLVQAWIDLTEHEDWDDSTIFPPFSSFAAGRYSQLWLAEQVNGHGYATFDADRFSEIDENSMTISVDHILSLPSDDELIADGNTVILFIQVDRPDCPGGWTSRSKIEILELSF